MRQLPPLSIGIVCFLVSACGTEVVREPNGNPAPTGGTSGAPTLPAAGTGCDFKPSNALPCDAAGPSIDIGSGCDDGEIDTTSGKFACGTTVPSRTFDQGAGRPKIMAFFVDGFRIGRDKTVRVTGDAALAIVSRGDVVIEGTLDASAENRECTAGPGGYRGGRGDGARGENGAGPGGGDGNGGWAGAGGGSYGGRGGAGGSVTGASPVSGAKGGTVYGEATLVPLLGGSGGGGDEYCGGGGGGAVQVTSSTSILIAAGGGIHVGGGSSKGYYGGGGSGGAILVEAPKIVVEGTLAANGGGGGYGCGALLGALPACGGENGGGVGSSAINADGAAGSSTTDHGGGGGGGAGRIRLVTTGAQAGVPGTLAPATATLLVSQAALAR
jgi:hypothetical protein